MGVAQQARSWRRQCPTTVGQPIAQTQQIEWLQEELGNTQLTRAGAWMHPGTTRSSPTGGIEPPQTFHELHGRGTSS
eukprot:11199247-Lingulodinium_polyedra.AAC.1